MLELLNLEILVINCTDLLSDPPWPTRQQRMSQI